MIKRTIMEYDMMSMDTETTMLEPSSMREEHNDRVFKLLQRFFPKREEDVVPDYLGYDRQRSTQKTLQAAVASPLMEEALVATDA